MAAAPTVAELLAMGPNLKIMVTSRAALHVYGEHEFPVPPLAMPDAQATASGRGTVAVSRGGAVRAAGDCGQAGF